MRYVGLVLAIVLLAGSGARTGATDGGVAPATALRQTWEGYKSVFVQGDGRVIDRERNQVTTSEGQSYTMLRAVWMDDRPAFAQVWGWTQNNLRQPGHPLFAWLWGQGNDGAWTVQDPHSAADADEDIALALVLAGRRWHDPTYLSDARSVLSQIWSAEVGSVAGRPYLAAGDWAVSPGQVVLDPSYLAPASYRVFAAFDHEHDWTALVGSSYSALQACSWGHLDAGNSVGLPPNWCVLSPGGASSYSGNSDGDVYGYDAFRVMWRVALDAHWFGSGQARSYLQGMKFLRHQWEQHHELHAQYSHDGTPVPGASQDPTVYGGDIGAFLTTAPSAARAILQQRLLATYQGGSPPAHWGDPNNYYEQNWVWFGVALATGAIPKPAG